MPQAIEGSDMVVLYGGVWFGLFGAALNAYHLLRWDWHGSWVFLGRGEARGVFIAMVYSGIHLSWWRMKDISEPSLHGCSLEMSSSLCCKFLVAVV